MDDTVIHLSASVAISLLGGILVMVGAFGKILLRQFEQRLAERSEHVAEMRQAERDTSERRLAGIENSLERESDRIGEIVSRIEKLNTTLPLEYVRREDWIRFSSTIDAKLDRLAEMIHTRLPGAPNE